MKDPKTVFVISSDFCHWGPNFDFQYYDKSKGAIWQSIEALDKEGVQFIESQDANVCGRDMNVGVCCLYGSNGNYDLWS